MNKSLFVFITLTALSTQPSFAAENRDLYKEKAELLEKIRIATETLQRRLERELEQEEEIKQLKELVARHEEENRQKQIDLQNQRALVNAELERQEALKAAAQKD